MKKKRLKNVVLSSMLVVAIAVSFFGITISKNLIVGNQNDNYSVPIIKEVTENELSETKDEKIVKPFNGEKVDKKVSYYLADESDENQEKAIFYYEKTYMPSTGIMYSSPDDFEVLAIYKGKITNIKDDEIFGKVVEITHNTNFVTYYYSLKDVIVNVGDEIEVGGIIGKSNTNKLSEQPSLFIECYYQGLSMNPESVYEKKPSELQ